MRNAEIYEKQPWIDANPRFYDRCNAVCGVVLGLALLAMISLALQEQHGPQPRGAGFSGTHTEEVTAPDDRTAISDSSEQEEQRSAS